MSAQQKSVEARESALAAKGRMVSIVIVGAMVLWMIIQFWLGPRLGMTVRYSLLVDLLAMAALLWSFIVSWQIKRARKELRAEKQEG